MDQVCIIIDMGIVCMHARMYVCMYGLELLGGHLVFVFFFVNVVKAWVSSICRARSAAMSLRYVTSYSHFTARYRVRRTNQWTFCRTQPSRHKSSRCTARSSGRSSCFTRPQNRGLPSFTPRSYFASIDFIRAVSSACVVL